MGFVSEVVGHVGRRSSNPWPHARNFNNLTRAGHGFVTGKVKSTPWHGAPLDPESVSLASTFAQLHEQGVLTIESQPGHCNRDEQKKSYLTGFLPSKHAHELDAALRRKGIVTYFYEYRTGRSFGSMDAYVRSHDEARVLTKERNGDTFKPYTSIPSEHMSEAARSELDMLNSAAARRDMTDRVCFFELVNPEFCASPGVEIVLLKEIKAIRNAKAKAR